MQSDLGCAPHASHFFQVLFGLKLNLSEKNLNCIVLVAREKNKLVSGDKTLPISLILAYKVLSLSNYVNQLSFSLFCHVYP